MNNFIFSKRSKDNFIGVNDRLIKVMRLALDITSVDFIVIDGFRTLERQKELFYLRKTKTLKSRHLTGRAVDIMPVGASWDDYTLWLPVLDAVYKSSKELNVGLVFGLTWTNNPNDPPARFLDAPHVELADD